MSFDHRLSLRRWNSAILRPRDSSHSRAAKEHKRARQLQRIVSAVTAGLLVGRSKVDVPLNQKPSGSRAAPRIHQSFIPSKWQFHHGINPTRLQELTAQLFTHCDKLSLAMILDTKDRWCCVRRILGDNEVAPPHLGMRISASAHLSTDATVCLNAHRILYWSRQYSRA